MPLYEHTMLARHSLTSQQATSLAEEFAAVLAENGGRVIDTEYWGQRNLAYRIRTNRKAHYTFMRLEAPHEAVQEMERRMRLSEDILRVLTVRVESHEEGPSAIMRAKTSRDSRPRRRRDEEEEGSREAKPAGNPPPAARLRPGAAESAAASGNSREKTA